jgi:phosphonate C-P lyase system protein PhnH
MSRSTVEPLTARARISGALSQQVFDVLLRTLAEPGIVRPLPIGLTDEVPRPLWLTLALADVDTPVHIHGDPDGRWAGVVAAATGAPIVAMGRARLVAAVGAEPPPLDQLAVGTPTAPEDGAKVALPVTALREASPDDPAAWELTGPGVPGHRLLRVDGRAWNLHRRIGRAAAGLPYGFDLWLMDEDGSVAAVPRSTTVTTVTTVTTADADADDERGQH